MTKKKITQGNNIQEQTVRGKKNEKDEIRLVQHSN